MPTRLVTPPTLKPISVAALKTHLRIDSTDEDEYLAVLIDVATQFVEERAWRALLTQTREIALDAWPGFGVIELPAAPEGEPGQHDQQQKDDLEAADGIGIHLAQSSRARTLQSRESGNG